MNQVRTKQVILTELAEDMRVYFSHHYPDICCCGLLDQLTQIDMWTVWEWIRCQRDYSEKHPVYVMKAMTRVLPYTGCFLSAYSEFTESEITEALDYTRSLLQAEMESKHDHAVH